MTFDCKIVIFCVHKVRTSTNQAVSIKTSSIYCIVPNTTTAESIPSTSPSVETDTTTIDETTTTTSTKTHKPEQGIVCHFHFAT